MKRIFALLVALTMCVTLFSACSDKKEKEESTPASLSEVNKELNDITVATIEGINVSQAYYNLIYSQQFFGNAQYYQDLSWLETKDENGQSGLDYLKEITKKQIEQGVMARIIAEREGITLTEDMKKRAKDEVAQFFQSNDKEFLVDSRTTEEAMLTFSEEQYLIEALIEKLSAEGGPAQLTDEDKKEAEEMFNQDYADKLRVQHILIQTTDAQTGAVIRSDEEALEKAKEVVSKLNEGIDFDSLIPQYNEDPGMTQGNYYTFGAGEMVAEFEEASRGLEFGKYTKTPVKSDYGYHVIKRYKIDTTIPEFEQYKNYQVVDKIGKMIDEEIAKITPEWKTDEVNSFISAFIEDQRAEFAAATANSGN